MNNKLGTELQIALETPDEIRRKSLDLNTGYKDNKWSLIIRHIGDLTEILDDYEIIGEALLGEFAIIITDFKKLIILAEDSRVLYVEKPKSSSEINSVRVILLAASRCTVTRCTQRRRIKSLLTKK